MNNYLKLIHAKTEYAMRMSRLRNRIFGDFVGKLDSSSRKVEKMFKENPIYKRDDIVNYYPRYMPTIQLMTKLRAYGLYRDEHKDFVEEMKRVRKLRAEARKKD